MATSDKQRERFTKEVQELLDKALKEPGVKEAMEVYQNWSQLNEIARAPQQAMTAKRIVSASDNSQAALPYQG